MNAESVNWTASLLLHDKFYGYTADLLEIQWFLYNIYTQIMSIMHCRWVYQYTMSHSKALWHTPVFNLLWDKADPYQLLWRRGKWWWKYSQSRGGRKRLQWWWSCRSSSGQRRWRELWHLCPWRRKISTTTSESPHTEDDCGTRSNLTQRKLEPAQKMLASLIQTYYSSSDWTCNNNNIVGKVSI